MVNHLGHIIFNYSTWKYTRHLESHLNPNVYFLYETFPCFRAFWFFGNDWELWDCKLWVIFLFLHSNRKNSCLLRFFPRGNDRFQMVEPLGVGASRYRRFVCSPTYMQRNIRILHHCCEGISSSSNGIIIIVVHPNLPHALSSFCNIMERYMQFTNQNNK